MALEDSAEDLYENAPCGYLSTRPDGTIVRVNGTLLAWTGYRREDLVGARRFPDILSAGGRIYHETHVAPLLQMQGAVRELALDVVCADGRRLPVFVNAALKRDEHGEPLLVRITVFDATDRKEYERELLRARDREREAREQVERLQRVTVVLSGTTEPEEIGRRIVRELVSGMGADRALLAVGERRAIVARVGDAPDAIGPPPAAAEFAEREVTLPLTAGGRTRGVVWLGFDAAREFGDDERTFMASCASQTAQALDRAYLHERTAREARRAAFHAEASRVLDEVDGLRRTRPAPAGAARAPDRRRGVVRPPGRVGPRRSRRSRGGPGGHDRAAAARAGSRRRPADPRPRPCARRARHLSRPAWARATCRSSPTSPIAPASRSRTPGSTNRSATSPMRCSRPCSPASHRATRASRWPPSTARRSRRSRSAATGSTPSRSAATGSPSSSATWSAAASPPRARWGSCAARSARWPAAGLGPADILDRLDVFVEQIDPARWATVAYAEVDLRTRRVRYACAGHPPPLAFEPDRPLRFLWEGRSPPLAVGGTRIEADDVLEPGARLLLYTDGLVERRAESLDTGLARLAAELDPRRAAPLRAARRRPHRRDAGRRAAPRRRLPALPRAPLDQFARTISAISRTPGCTAASGTWA